MRRLPLLAVLLGLGISCGCGKKPAPPPPEADAGAGADKGATPTPADETAAWRNKQLAALKARQDAPRRAAIDELSYLVLEDPDAGLALIELMKDKGTNGAGQTPTNQINSTREAAATALLKAGPKGESLLKEKGLPILRDGLADPAPAVREHSAYTIGQLGPMAKPLAGDIQKLCTDKDANVRRAAFDALRATGVADPVALAKLLTSENEEVARLAAELVSLVTDMPEGAVAPLSAALGSANTNVQTAAANGLAAAGPKAASAVPLLVAAVDKYYPKEYDPKAARVEGIELAYWLALARAGEAAVAPLAKLLDHPNVLVRSQAARTLGEIGPSAKVAKDALKKALNDQTINVAAEAAVALVALGEAQDEAVRRIKEAIDFPTQGIAAYAIDVIPRMGDAGKALVALAAAKVADRNPYTRFAAVALVGKLPPAESTKYAGEVGKLATDAEPDIRRLVARVLTQLGPAGAPAADALGKALAVEKELDIRDQFVEALLAMGTGAKPALPALLPLVAKSDVPVQVRVNVIAALVVADPSSPEVAAALVKGAAESEAAIRAASASAMGQLNPLPADALSVLVKMAKGDSKNGPRVAALRALTVAGPRAKPARAEVDALTANPQPGLAIWAKVALAAVDGDVSKSAPLVRAGLNDRNAAVRASAAQALLLVGATTDDLPVLLKLLREGGSSTRAAAATALGRLGAGAKDAVPQLTRLLDDGEAEVRLPAAEALGRIGPAARPAADKLKDLLRDPLVRATAQQALERIGAK